MTQAGPWDADAMWTPEEDETPKKKPKEAHVEPSDGDLEPSSDRPHVLLGGMTNMYVIEYRLDEDRGTVNGPLRFYAKTYDIAARVADDLRNDQTVQTDSVAIT